VVALEPMVSPVVKAMQEEKVLMVETAEMANLVPQVLQAPEGPLAPQVPVALKEIQA
jgi:hypothetical protein